MKRTAMIALVGSVALVGCRDMGLEYNIPFEEAAQKPPMALVAAAYPVDEAGEAPHIVLDGTLWVPSGVPGTVSEGGLRPVGAAQGRTVYARSWDRAPYGELFTRVEEGPVAEIGAQADWQSYLPVIGGGTPGAGPVDAGEAAQPGEGH